MKSKIIKVSEETHKNLKVGAANAGMTIRNFVEEISMRNKKGVAFDVDIYSVDYKIAVMADIIIDMQRNKDKMTSEQKKEFLGTIEEVSFNE